MKRLVAVHQIETWREYLESRLVDFVNGACPENNGTVDIASAQVILPKKMDSNLIIDHDFDSRFFERGSPTHEGWQYREDAYSLGVERLVELSKIENRSWLFCYSEYSKPTDGVLRKRRHFVQGDKVFLLSNLDIDTNEKVAKTLRQARSNRTLAILIDSQQDPCDGLEGGIFCTDVFDGDLLVVCRIKSNEKVCIA